MLICLSFERWKHTISHVNERKHEIEIERNPDGADSLLVISATAGSTGTDSSLLDDDGFSARQHHLGSAAFQKLCRSLSQSASTQALQTSSLTDFGELILVFVELRLAVQAR